MLDDLELFVEKELARLCDKNITLSQPKVSLRCPLKESVNLIIQTDKEIKESKKSEQETCSFRPMLSRKSMKIAEKLGDPKERLTRPRSVTPEPQQEHPKRIRTTSGIAPRWEQLYSLNQFYKTKKEAIKTQVELERSKDIEATFRPNLSKSQMKYCEFQMPFDQRNRYWETKKQEKLQQQLKEQLTQTKSQCTFKPKINKKQEDKNNIKVTDFNKKGLITYFERIQQAKQKKEEPKKLNKWKPGITQPQEFKLSHQQR